jgi:plastocyanin
MKRLIFLAIAFAVISLAFAPTGMAAVRTQIVHITAKGFIPRDVIAPRGTEVIWINNDTVDRKIVSDTNIFSSPVLKPGAEFRFRFPVRGTYSYRGELKPEHRAVVSVMRSTAHGVRAAVSRRWVTFGQSVEVTGGISSARGGEIVRVFITPYEGLQQMKRVATRPDGTWRFRYRPKVRTEFYAEHGGLLSRSVPLVYVRPRLTLTVRNASIGQFVARARAAESYAGKLVYLQRRIGNRWRIVTRARLGTNGAVRFRATLPLGTHRLRITTPPSPGYLRGFSSVVTVRR